MHKYLLVNIQYISNIKKNKFKPENIIKLTTNIKHIKKMAKSLKISINNLEIKTKKEDCIIANTKDIILLFQVFYIYMQIFIFFTTLKIKL